MSIDVLKEDLKINKVRNLYLFYGPEEYLKKYYMDAIERSVLKDDMAELNKCLLEGKVDGRKVIDASETLPVFSDRKLVIIKNSTLFKSKKKDGESEGKAKPHDDDIIGYLKNLPDYSCLVFLENEIDKRIKLVDAIKKNGLIVEFPYQKAPELVKWVIKAFKSNHKDIDQMSASQLVESSEPGMNEILNEINKVVTYLGERTKVTSRDIDQVCTKSIKSRIFELTDAIAESNGDKALKYLNDMVILKEPLPKILFMITRQFRQILEMKTLTGMGCDSGEACRKMGITPYAASKIMKQAGRFSAVKLKDALKESLELDIAIKSGKINDRMAAELLICKFAK